MPAACAPSLMEPARSIAASSRASCSPSTYAPARSSQTRDFAMISLSIAIPPRKRLSGRRASLVALDECRLSIGKCAGEDMFAARSHRPVGECARGGMRRRRLYDVQRIRVSERTVRSKEDVQRKSREIRKRRQVGERVPIAFFGEMKGRRLISARFYVPFLLLRRDIGRAPQCELPDVRARRIATRYESRVRGGDAAESVGRGGGLRHAGGIGRGTDDAEAARYQRAAERGVTREHAALER